MLLLPPLLPCLCSHSPALVHVCQLSFSSHSPAHPLLFTRSCSPFACSRPPLSFSFTCPPSFVHHCPHPLVASLVTSLLHPPALPIFPWPRMPVHQPFMAALACSSMCVHAALVGVSGALCEMAVGDDAGWWWVWVKRQGANTRLGRVGI